MSIKQVNKITGKIIYLVIRVGQINLKNIIIYVMLFIMRVLSKRYKHQRYTPNILTIFIKPHEPWVNFLHKFLIY